MQSVQVGYGNGFEYWDGSDGRTLMREPLRHLLPNKDTDHWQRAYRFSIIRILNHLREHRTTGDLMVAHFNLMHLPKALNGQECQSGFGELVGRVTELLQSYLRRNLIDDAMARELLVQEREDYFSEDRSYIKPCGILHLNSDDEIRIAQEMDKTFYTLHLDNNSKPLNPDFIYCPKQVVISCLDGRFEVNNPTLIYNQVNSQYSHVVISVGDRYKELGLYNRQGVTEYVPQIGPDWKEEDVRLAHGMSMSLARDLLSYFMGFPSIYASWITQSSASSVTASSAKRSPPASPTAGS